MNSTSVTGFAASAALSLALPCAIGQECIETLWSENFDEMTPERVYLHTWA